MKKTIQIGIAVEAGPNLRGDAAATKGRPVETQRREERGEDSIECEHQESSCLGKPDPAAAGPFSSRGERQTHLRAAKRSFSALQRSSLLAGCEQFLLCVLRVSAFLLPPRTPLPVPEALSRSLRHASTLHAPTLHAPLPAVASAKEGRSHAPAPAFSLIEILVTTALLSFIIVGLVAMFAQTQRAFTQSLTDVDLLENGRAVMELVARDLAEAAPANLSNAVNFYAEIPGPSEKIYTPPLSQALPGNVITPQQRLNYLQPFYFLSHPNQMWPDRAWAATGYYVVPDVAGVGIGTLYRFAATNAVPPLPTSYAAIGLDPSRWGNSFVSALATLRTDAPLLTVPASTVTRVVDGVVHLSVRLFATNGFPIGSDIISGPMYGYTAYLAGTNSNGTYLEYPRPLTEVTNHLSLAWPDYYDRCWFYSNALPACVELELGILERQTYQRYKAIASANPAAASLFLSNHVAQVHLFRQRVPIHNVDPSAY